VGCRPVDLLDALGLAHTYDATDNDMGLSERHPHQAGRDHHKDEKSLFSQPCDLRERLTSCYYKVLATPIPKYEPVPHGIRSIVIV
jgi:hypothetical protein